MKSIDQPYVLCHILQEVIITIIITMTEWL